MKKWFFIAALAIAGYWQYDQNREVQQADGVVAKAAPLQRALVNAAVFTHEGYSVTPLANFALEARVLSRKQYSLGREADLSPVDLALGWGPMSDNHVLEKIDISQGNRFYYWRVEQFPIPQDEIIRHSSNMHMIPANTHVAKQLAGVRKGNVVAITGQLVKVNAADGWHWQSSLSRTDTGSGACELVWVKEVSVL
ncbi:hypothetical protein [Sulfuriflexus mobilis]|uniref:hypothetical protein n=1 Tax=Sulfuriflexus mobilis TaxID=1811807 RepID=UPI000F83378C|nr:hypothetical protein [Sulfuriflexus mobilis]